MGKNTKTPEEIYNDQVKDNIDNWGKEYKDPDVVEEKTFRPIIFVDNINNETISIKMATDGLCGYKKIASLKDYEIIRMGKYEALKWPVQSMSINQKRGFSSVFDDRLDMTLIEIENFYKAVENEHYSVSSILKIKDSCRAMWSVFLNEPTLMWLCSFANFSEFVIANNLQVFVKEKKENVEYEAVKWTNEEGEKARQFSKEYYTELIKRAKAWKKQ